MNTALITEIDTRIEIARQERPMDIDKMLARLRDIGKNFTTSMYAQVDTNSCAYVLYMLYTMAKDKSGEVQTIKKFAAEYLSFYGFRYKTYYDMDDIHALFLKTALSIKDTDSYEELALYFRTLQRYTGQLAYWIDLSLPYAKLCKAFQKIMLEESKKK